MDNITFPCLHINNELFKRTGVGYGVLGYVSKFFTTFLTVEIANARSPASVQTFTLVQLFPIQKTVN